MATTVDAGASYSANTDVPDYENFGVVRVTEQKYNPWVMPPPGAKAGYPQSLDRRYRSKQPRLVQPKFVTPEELEALENLPEADAGNAPAWQPLNRYTGQPGYGDIYGSGQYGSAYENYNYPSYGGLMGMPGYMIDPYSGTGNNLMFDPYGYRPFGDSYGSPYRGMFPLSY